MRTIDAVICLSIAVSVVCFLTNPYPHAAPARDRWEIAGNRERSIGARAPQAAAVSPREVETMTSHIAALRMALAGLQDRQQVPDAGTDGLATITEAWVVEPYYGSAVSHAGPPANR